MGAIGQESFFIAVQRRLAQINRKDIFSKLLTGISKEVIYMLIKVKISICKTSHCLKCRNNAILYFQEKYDFRQKK